jgi:hypothetical protein
MPYTDFDLTGVETRLGVKLHLGEMFPSVTPIPVPGWLTDQLDRGRAIARLTEKARSELIIAPILLGAREVCGRVFAIFSGHRLDVDQSRGLAGECDFILSRQEAVPVLRTPVIAVVEAKRGDVDAGIGQCLAQMIGAVAFNEQRAKVRPPVYGCVTTGDEWQFLRLEGADAVYDTTRRYISDLGELLGVFSHIAADTAPPPGTNA